MAYSLSHRRAPPSALRSRIAIPGTSLRLFCNVPSTLTTLTENADGDPITDGEGGADGVSDRAA